MLPIAGYLNRLSAAPGDRVDVKVGSFGAKSYRASLLRIIQGDTNPEGPGYKVEEIALDLGGERIARPQPLLAGSQVYVPDRGGVLASLRSFTIATPVWPTLLGDGDRVVLAVHGIDCELGIDSGGMPYIRHGGARAQLRTALRLKEWALLVGTVDADKKTVTISAKEHGSSSFNSSTESAAPISDSGAAHVTIAGWAPGERHFDGKIDSPAIFLGSQDPLTIAVSMSQPGALWSHPDLVAFWDFSQDIDGPSIRDVSPHRLGGVTTQCPARAMTGWLWNAERLNWQEQPRLYSAIHFHSDDMSDARWRTDFSFEVPLGLRSGIYAVQLIPDGNAADGYHCVFAVRPSRSTVTGAKACFLMPTASYLAYANHRLGLDVPGTEVGMGRLIEVDRHHAFLQTHPELGFSFYETHSDGSGVFYSSRHRPIVDMQPGVKGFLGGLGSNVWQFNADTHIVGWLEESGIDYDVITDEDLHHEGLSLLRRYKTVITGTHPEYYSLAMLNAVLGFVDRGGRLMYLGGNGFYWRISFSDNYPGVIECRRSEAGIRPWEPGHGQFHHAFTGEYGGLWRRNGRPSGVLTGLVMSSQGFDISEPYILKADPSDERIAFMFEGIEIRKGDKLGDFGLSGGGAAGLEIDRVDYSLGTPAHACVIGSSERHTDIYLMTPEDLLDPTPDMTGTQNDLIRADLVFFETRSGGAVFSTGSIAWAGAVAWNNYQNDIARMTRNVLVRFLDEKPFTLPSSLPTSESLIQTSNLGRGAIK